MTQPTNALWPWADPAQLFAPLMQQAPWLAEWGNAMQQAAASASQALPAALPVLHFDPEKMRALQTAYIQDATALWNSALQAPPELKDRRFKNEAWAQNPLAAWTAAAYLLNARTLMALADEIGRAHV